MGKLQMQRFVNSKEDDKQTKSKVNMADLQDMLSGFSNSELAKFISDRNEEEEEQSSEKATSVDLEETDEEESEEDRVVISEEVIGTRMECLKFSKQVLQEQAAIDFEMLNKVPQNYDIDKVIAGAEKLFKFLINQEI